MRRGAGYTSDDRQNGPPLPLPNLPGLQPSLQHTLGPRPKAHTLKYVNGYPITEDVGAVMDPHNRGYKWGGRIQDAGPMPPFALHEGAAAPQHERQRTSREQFMEPGSSGRTGRMPNWIAYDRKVLRFGGYFREEVPTGVSAVESWRVRKVCVRYYLENDMVEIVEMREENSGLPQGILLKRHCAVKEGGSPLRWPDLRVGGSVTLYRREYVLVAADGPTRAFYAEQGQEQPPDEPFPEGPYDQRRKLEASRNRAQPRPAPAASFSIGPPIPPDPADLSDPYAAGPRIDPRGPAAVFDLLPAKKPEALERRDGAVLRFLAAWDNSAVTFGEVLGFSLAYHVADGSIEVREVTKRNDGRDPFPLLLSRCRLPKTVPPVYGRPMSPGTRRELQLQYYDWRDLYLGATVNVYGRPLLLYDCDEPTRDWLRQHVPGIREEQLKPVNVDFDPHGPKRPPLSIPPHSGFGSEEDSLQSCLRLVPRALPRPTPAEYDDAWNKALRFEAALTELGPGRPLVGPHDAERRFIFSFHLLDRTVSIWEPKRPNSGMEGGTFLERTRVRNPATGRDYAETDLQVGCVLEIFGRGFALLDADAFTLGHMEQQPHRFPWADYERVHSKLHAWLALYPDALPERLKAELAAADTSGSGYLPKHTLYSLLARLGSDLSPHEVVTLVRRLGADRQGLLAEQLLAALGLGPPPEELQQEARRRQAEEEAPQPPAPPPVPFPAPGLRTAAAGGDAAPQPSASLRVAWGAQSIAAAAPAAGPAAPPAATAYRGIGPIPGQPRVEPAPASAQPPQYLSAQRTPGQSWTGSYSSGDDRQTQRDTPTKNTGGNGSSSASSLQSSLSAAALAVAAAAKSRGSSGSLTSSGIPQPKSLWQTTNMAFGGVGHAASLRKR